MLGAVGAIASGSSAIAIAAQAESSAIAAADRKAAKWHAEHRQFAHTRFGRIAYLKRGAGPVALFLHGFADPIYSNDSPNYLRSILPNVTSIRRLPNAKLFFPEEYPDAIAEEAGRLWSA